MIFFVIQFDSSDWYIYLIPGHDLTRSSICQAHVRHAFRSLKIGYRFERYHFYC